MKIGNINISNLKLGTVQIKKVFIGLDLVWTSFLSIINDFKARVLSNQGQFEDENCLNDTLEDMGIDFFDEASLVVTPNGYKENVLYTIKPNNSASDFLTTRATIGTRVNTDGYIEEVPYNLLQQSETFENSYWTKNLGTITANDAIAPNGTMTADLFTKTSAVNTVSSVNRSTVYTVTGVYTLSIFIKPKIGNVVLLRMDGNNTANASFNFTTKIFTNSGANFISSSYEELTDGWFRLSMTSNVIATNWVTDVCNLFSNPTGDAMWIWGAQLVPGTQQKDYFPTTNRFNIPRLDYESDCPSLLIEQVRSNIFVRSEEFDNNSWTKISSSATPDTTLAPTGLVKADTITSTATSQTIVLQLRTITSGTVYSISFYVKQNTQRFVYIRFTSQSLAQNYVSAVFDLQDGTTGQTSVGTTSGTLISSDIVDAGNGFYRVSITASINVTDGNIGIGFAAAKTGNTFNTSGVITSTITNGNSIFLWGAQMEAGYEPTSYIATTNAQLTRNGDYIFRDAIQDLIGQTEGSIYCEFSVKYNRNWNGAIFVLRGLTPDNRIAIRFNSNPPRPSGGYLNLLISAGGTFVVNLNVGTLIPAANQRYKVCATYNQTEQKVYVNGVLVATRTGSYTQPSTLTTVQLAGYSGTTTANGNINLYSGLVFKNVLTDTQAIQLTTL